jgi:hypothetical protein
VKPKLEYASHGPYVTELQTKLNTLMPAAQPPLKVDGKYGEATVTRVKQFQKSRGLVADGVVGARTWAAVDGLPFSPANPGAPAPHYNGIRVYRGYRLRCEYGTRHSVFMLWGAPLTPATVVDCRFGVNILPFGECTSSGHPNYVAPYHDPYMDVSFQFKYPKAIQKQAFACIPVIESQWLGNFTSVDPNGTTHLIDKSAYCICRFGGRIFFG